MSKVGESKVGQTALYRKYRPRSLSELVSQPQVTDVLSRSLKQGRIAHAYLLTGPKGVGKTSIARIMAHEINGLEYSEDGSNLDIIEIDAASNNGVDDVRDLREKANIAPIASAKKIYIIDEVHMLSKQAFNALLKTLEEPPSHVVFILATTDLHKVPATIISRTQHFALHSISESDLTTHLQKIAKGEGIKMSDEAAKAIASRGDGSFRNSISLLDQLSTFSDDKDGITLDLVEATLGLAPQTAVESILNAINERDVTTVISQLDTLETQGIQPTVFVDQLITTIRRNLPEQPQLITLLDNLLSVFQSTQPHLKLLTVLVGYIKPTSSPQRVATAPVAKSAAAVFEVPILKVSEPVIDNIPKKAEKAIATELDWEKLIEYTRENLIALHSVLSKCTFKLEDNTLTLYAGRKFNKTKLDEVKYQAQLNEALKQVGVDNLYIITLPNTEPPADERLAKITEIMGGGHEVTLDEVST
ncbi:MAG: DNA polymerase III subunit gamma/tau [Candidatus Saccharimonadales bacterium]